MAKSEHIEHLRRSQTRIRVAGQTEPLWLPDAVDSGEFDFSGHDFSEEANPNAIANCEFLIHARFTDCHFPPNFIFTSVRFSHGASFTNCRFSGDLLFDDVQGDLAFTGARFGGNTKFKKLKAGHVDFSAINVQGHFDVEVAPESPNARIDCGSRPTVTEGRIQYSDEAVFEGPVYFTGFCFLWVRNALFKSTLQIRGTDSVYAFSFELCKFASVWYESRYHSTLKLLHGASFKTCECWGQLAFDSVEIESLDLSGSIFHTGVFLRATRDREPIGRLSCDNAEFRNSVYFENRTFTGATSFRNAMFYHPPLFHGAALHQDTTFDFAEFGAGIEHPSAERAFRTIKLAMHAHQAHEAALVFFGLEMQARAYREKNRLVKWAYRCYGIVSNYGHSVRRPFKWLLLLILASIPITAIIVESPAITQCLVGTAQCTYSEHRARAIMELALTQSVPLAPALKDAAADAYRTLMSSAPLWQVVLYFGFAVAQAILSVFLVFLIGLGFRNRFRLH